jgi:hypothetical protein
MIARFMAPLALFLSVPAAAESLEGSWALKIGGAAIFRFDLTKDGDGKWTGVWSKPSSFASNGDSFSRLTGPPKKVSSMTALDTPDGIELSFDDPRPGAVPDIFDFKSIDRDAVEMTYVGTGLSPYTLERVEHDAPLGPWDAGASYSRKASPQSEPTPASAPAPDEPPPSDPGGFRLKPGAPVGR